ncbi:protein dachsous-like [Argopecten irradians]|uniref:protein dachsous-like n=1 Tax=Argopecten irradians TaxID=31199 RepID=UPI00371E2A96
MIKLWIYCALILQISQGNAVNVAPDVTGLPTSVGVGELETANRLIYTISATDPDNDAFLCDVTSTIPADGPFVCRKDSDTDQYGVYTDNPAFVYATNPVHTINISCTDSGGLTGTGTLSVDIIENDRLTFNDLPDSTSHNAATTNNGDRIYRVKATDDLANTALTFNITGSVPATTSFAINTGNGDITATRDLITETYDSFKLYITVSDGGISVVDVLTVTLTNIQTAPIITNLVLNSVTTLSFSESTAAQAVLFTLDVYDPDTGQTYVTFDTTPAAEASTFNLTNNVLSLASLKLFNFEDHITYTLAFYVTDTIFTTGPYYLQITVIDEGEVCVFDKQLYEYTVEEGGIGSAIIDLGFTITDPDNPDSQTYTIQAGTDSHLFGIDSNSGILTFAVDYDYENGNHPKNATLVIECTDTYYLTGSTNVTIYVQDKNDNAPDFNAGGYVVEVNQLHTLGEVFGTLNATDRDSGNNGEIEYTGHSSTGSSYYRIAKNGQIVLLTDLPFDYGTTHRFYVTAVDHGFPQLTGTTYVDIVYRYRTTTTRTTTTTTLGPTDFWTVENIALIAAVGALALLGLLLLLCLLLRNTGCCPSNCSDLCKCPKRPPKRIIVTPQNPKTAEWKLWDNNELNVHRKPFVTNVTETAIPQTMKM